MNLLGNIIWIIFGGLIISIEYFISGMPASDFWDAVKDKEKRDSSRVITEQLIFNRETQRTLVINPFVYYDISKPQFRAELVKTIDLLKQLKTVLS